MTEAKKRLKTLSPSDFVHLHNHTHHSLLDGLTKVPELIDSVKKMGMEAVAITDHGTLSGAIEFYKACVEQGIKPIIGIETYVAARTIADKDPTKDKTRHHLIILAMNNIGYGNLMRLSTIAHLDGMYYKPRIDHELLEKYNEGLIVLSACAGSELGELLRAGNYEPAKKTAQWYKKIFGDRYYLELADHGHPDAPLTWDEQVKLNSELLKLASELDIQTVVTSDAHYLKAEDKDPHEILLCVQTGSYYDDEDRMSLKEFDLHVTDPRELIKRWSKDCPKAITNTKAIADRCNIKLDLGKTLIPVFPVPKKETERTYLEKLVWQGLAWRYGSIEELKTSDMTETNIKKVLTKAVIERAQYELGVINSMGFNGYFLIVQDFVNWGKDRGIIFGPGRGSAAGSIVAYGLKITDLDPLHYDLMFERFLNPSRISMPDIDIDIQDSRRDEVIKYCVEKYGPERVANITTFGTMAARAAVRDVARVLQVPYAEADKLAKLIPAPVQGRHILLSKSIVSDADLKREYDSNPTAKKVIDYAVRLEGTIRSHGVHAAGVVIAPDDIVNYAPLEMSQKGVVATQYTFTQVEELGLLKMDFLGLSNLTTINNALRIIKKVHGQTIDLHEIDMQDAKTFDLLQRADTTGVFQLESAGMKRYLKQLGPTLFEDIIAMVALYRPGPMAEIPRFIKGKNNASSITYMHESLKPILSDTYGVMVFQEQIINLLQLIAGYSPGEADLVRKAIGKKNRTIMMAEEPKFIAGCLKQGLSEINAKKLWTLIQPFADYSFNKAHAACYGLIAYQTAYLKAHYPDAFMAALMTSDQDDIERLAIEISECSHMGLKVLAPDVNQSFVEFGIVPNERQVRFGMAAVKGVGTAAVEEILRARDEGGSFHSIADFAGRVSSKKVNRKALESLIKAGAFDEIATRSDLLFNIDMILGYSSRIQKDTSSNQADLFGGLNNVVAIPDLALETSPVQHSESERLQWERELLGLYLSAHPLDAYENYFEEKTIPLVSITIDHDKNAATVGGVISVVRIIQTKNGSKMAFVTLEDKSGEGEIIVFPKIYESIGKDLVQDAIVSVNGRVSTTDKEGNRTSDVKILAEKITVLSQDELDNYRSVGKKMTALKAKKPSKVSVEPTSSVMLNDDSHPDGVSKTLYVHVKDPGDHDKLLRLKKSFNQFPGESHIILVLGPDKKSAIRLPFTTEPSEELKTTIAKLYGLDCVVVK